MRDLIDLGVPLSVESRIEPGQNVRVRNGAFAGFALMNVPVKLTVQVGRTRLTLAQLVQTEVGVGWL